jgi:serine/threonine protein kinase
MTQLQSGDRLGVYEIVALLGRGGMGTVYRAIDTRLDRPVAVKVVDEEFSAFQPAVAHIHAGVETAKSYSTSWVSG